MPIRYVDRRAFLGELPASLGGVSGLIQGTHVGPPGRTGIITTQLGGITSDIPGSFRPNANRTGVISTTLSGAAALILGSFAISAPYFGFAPTIYAHPATAQGNGSGSSEANARTLLSALAIAVPGDIIGVLPGIAIGSSTFGKYVPAFHPANSGTAGNPIRIVAKYPWTNTANRTELRTNATTSGIGSPTIGAHFRSFIEWYNFYIDEANAKNQGDSGNLMISESTGVKAFYCRLIGEQAFRPEDNHCGYYINESSGVELVGLTISGYRSSNAGHPNGAGGMEYGANGTVRNCEIFDCGSGLYIKGHPNTIWNQGLRARNHIWGCHIPIVAQAIDPTNPLIVEHNLLRDYVNAAMLLNTSAGADTVRNILIRRNTMTGPANALSIQAITGGGNQVVDNLIALYPPNNNQPYLDCGGYTANNFASVRSNGFFGSTQGQPFNWNGTNFASRAEWEAAVANSSNNQVLGNDPLANRGSGNYAVTGAALIASSTGGPIGADFSLVGPGAG